MTDPQAAREQIAKEWFSARKITPYGGDIEALVALITSTEVRVLEEVECRFSCTAGLVQWCKKQIQERTP